METLNMSASAAQTLAASPPQVKSSRLDSTVLLALNILVFLITDPRPGDFTALTFPDGEEVFSRFLDHVDTAYAKGLDGTPDALLEQRIEGPNGIRNVAGQLSEYLRTHSVDATESISGKIKSCFEACERLLNLMEAPLLPPPVEQSSDAILDLPEIDRVYSAVGFKSSDVPRPGFRGHEPEADAVDDAPDALALEEFRKAKPSSSSKTYVGSLSRIAREKRPDTIGLFTAVGSSPARGPSAATNPSVLSGLSAMTNITARTGLTLLGYSKPMDATEEHVEMLNVTRTPKEADLPHAKVSDTSNRNPSNPVNVVAPRAPSTDETATNLTASNGRVNNVSNHIPGNTSVGGVRGSPHSLHAAGSSSSGEYSTAINTRYGHCLAVGSIVNWIASWVLIGLAVGILTCRLLGNDEKYEHHIVRMDVAIGILRNIGPLTVIIINTFGENPDALDKYNLFTFWLLIVSFVASIMAASGLAGAQRFTMADFLNSIADVILLKADAFYCEWVLRRPRARRNRAAATRV